MQQNKKIAIQIEGMTCQSCANRIEKVLNRNDFVSDAGVNFAAEEAHVVFDSSQASEQDILTIIQKAGYKGILKQNVLPSAPNETKMDDSTNVAICSCEYCATLVSHSFL